MELAAQCNVHGKPLSYIFWKIGMQYFILFKRERAQRRKGQRLRPNGNGQRTKGSELADRKGEKNIKYQYCFDSFFNQFFAMELESSPLSFSLKLASISLQH
ncbi:hypothetical protein L1987_18203 [Smallanthus sonchifolius]|uniref:Uncharacterized protein n=1 Tax=Smallanthus sonchifolius TaxID=185202 RepID=A0ACB9J0K7_9ASTR|nr:hypothetical protein L1987_18203 [Smallanthus sonchifolius]